MAKLHDKMHCRISLLGIKAALTGRSRRAAGGAGARLAGARHPTPNAPALARPITRMRPGRAGKPEEQGTSHDRVQVRRPLPGPRLVRLSLPPAGIGQQQAGRSMTPAHGPWVVALAPAATGPVHGACGSAAAGWRSRPLEEQKPRAATGITSAAALRLGVSNVLTSESGCAENAPSPRSY